MKLLPEWIWKEENRAVASFIGGAVVAVIAGIWAVFSYVTQHASHVEPQAQVTKMFGSKPLRVCRGDTKEKCIPMSAFIGCTSIENFAQQECKGEFRIEPTFKLNGGLRL
jgi:uncharacterized membrane protein